jgi:hypothetical protein
MIEINMCMGETFSYESKILHKCPIGHIFVVGSNVISLKLEHIVALLRAVVFYFILIFSILDED